MPDVLVDADREQVFLVTEQESRFIEAGDFAAYVSLLTEDAEFMPPGMIAQSGQELRDWMAEFLRTTRVRYLDFQHGETEIREDLAMHVFTCTWTAAPRAGGEPKVTAFKGLQVLRRTAEGTWKLAREIWNTNPTPPLL